MALAVDKQELQNRIRETMGWEVEDIAVVTNTSEFMDIYRGQVVELGGKHYLILGDTCEGRFGLDNQPKFWVKTAVDLATGKKKIVKMVFHEEFIAHIGPLHIRCYRSPEKEARVLDLVKGDMRFMQGFSAFDEAGNTVRIIDFIHGESLYKYIIDLQQPHEEYLFTAAPKILKHVLQCMAGIQLLHANRLCHGDIRNDHIIIDKDTGDYRWIDFDLTQDYSDFDVWGIGNVLNFVIGKGINTFHQMHDSTAFSDKIKEGLVAEDASAFYEYRIMNLQKIFPYLPDPLNRILLHFTATAEKFYSSMAEVIEDVEAALIGISGD